MNVGGFVEWSRTSLWQVRNHIPRSCGEFEGLPIQSLDVSFVCVEIKYVYSRDVGNLR